MNPQVDPTTGAYQPFTSYGAAPYNPNNQSANPSTLDAIQTGVNKGQSLLSSINTPSKPSTPKPAAPKGNFFERLLPTIGGVAGGLLGLPLNALDAVSGIGGTALDAGLAGGGSALGKFLENKLTGNKDAGQGVLGSGLLGAAGQGVGEGIGSVGGALLGKLGNKATSVGADMIQGQAAKGYLNDAESTMLQNKGITNLKQVPAIFNEVSGSNGMFPNLVKDTFANSDQGVNITGLDQVANNLAAEQGTLDSTSIKQINSALNTAINNSIPGDVTPIATKGTAASSLYSYEPGALSNALPENTFAQTQKLEQLANAAYKKGFDPYTKQVTDPRNAGLYNVFKGMADHMEKASFGGDTPIPLTDEMKTTLLNSPQMAKLTEINPKAAAGYSSDIGDAQFLQDLRPMQSLIVRANNAVQGTAAKAGVQAGTNAMDTAKSVGAPLSLALNHPLVAAGSLALSSPGADRLGASVLSNLGPKLAGASDSAIPQAAGGALGVTVANSPNDIPAPQGGTIGGMNPAGGNSIGATAPNPLQGSLLSQVLGQDVTAGQESLVDPYLAGNFSSQIGQLGTLIPLAQKVAAAEAATQGLAGTFNQAGGGQGPIGGLLSRLGQTFTGGPASLLGSNLNTQEQGAAKALGGAAGIPSNEIMTPQVTQNQGTAQTALQNMVALISALGGGPAQGNSSVLSGL